ncbi:MAG: hypothetical protein ABUL44_04305, partial [Flavobacterium sp.]
MKKVFLVAFLFSLVKISTAQVQFDALTISPQMPKAGQTVNFKYNTQLSSLIEQKKVDIVIYFWVTTGYKVAEPKIIKTGSTFSGSFKVDEKATAFAFGFSSDKEKDNNGGKGYYLPVYNNKNEPITEYYSGIYSFQRLYGEALFGITYNPQNSLNIFEEGLKQHPELKKDPTFLNTYLYALNGAKKAAAIPLIYDELSKFENAGHLTEAGYNTLIQWYSRDKKQGKVDSLTADKKAAFP